MSAQFGRWNLTGRPCAPDYLEKISTMLAPYGPDGNGKYSKAGTTIFHYALHVTKESRRETQPHVTRSGVVITWDGILDNREDLIRDLRDSLRTDSTDVAIVAEAYEKWGNKCLGKLIGDWALSIWDPADQSLLLARDPLGTHRVYYTCEKEYVAWSSILDPLVLCSERTFRICDEYVAGWFLCVPEEFLTPYVGIHAVPSSSMVILRNRQNKLQHTVSKYWDFDPAKKIRYRNDAEYEEHFRTIFSQAVKRKLRSDRPVLAELSGGMDSTSIVCMADTIIARGQAECPRLDTLSWYDDSFDDLEPDTNELHWFRKVEEKRGRTGYHINHKETSAIERNRPPITFVNQFDSKKFAAIPAPNNHSSSEFFKRTKEHIASQGYRVILSGIGGDESTGAGVPSPVPELQNLIARCRFLTLARQLNAWAAKMKRPRLSVLWEAVQGFFYVPLLSMCADALKTPWLTPRFVKENRPAFCGYPRTTRLFGALPSFQDHMDALQIGRRFFAASGGPVGPESLAEERYPFTDRDLREFVYAIPREQLVGVGKRRYLMKRALAGIVPQEILDRKRKAFGSVPPADKPKEDFSSVWPTPAEIGSHILASSAGFINSGLFLEALEKARRNEAVPAAWLGRTLTLEFWLRHLASYGVLEHSASSKSTVYSERFRLRVHDAVSQEVHTSTPQGD